MTRDPAEGKETPLEGPAPAAFTRREHPPEPTRYARCVDCDVRLKTTEMISDSQAKWRCRPCVSKRVGRPL